MNLFTRSLLAMALAASPLAALAAEGDTQTITVSNATGSFTSGNSGNTYFSTWKSTQTSPQLTISCGANNFSPFDTNGNLVYNSGSGSSSTITLSASDGWYVSAYSFDATLVNSTASITYSANGATAVTIGTEATTISATDIANGTTASIAVSGTNSGVTLSNFTVTLTEGPAPQFYTTTINDDGTFAEETPWYTLQIASVGYYLKTVNAGDPIELNSVDVALDDNELWCFVGNSTDGYRIYNKALGSTKALAAPNTVGSDGNTGGSSYAAVVDVDQTGYIYEWIPSYSNSISGVDGIFLAAKGNTSWKLNNRSYKLAFWTGGADAGSTLRVLLSKFTALIDPSTGSTNDASKTWVNTWTRTNEPQVSFGTGYNNMTISNSHIGIAVGSSVGTWGFTVPTGMHVSDYEFDYTQATTPWSVTNTLTLGGGDAITIDDSNTTGHASLTGLASDATSSFTYAGTNGKVLELSNFKVTVCRDIPVIVGTIVFRYDGTPDYNVVYRIPAITTINAGKNAGRVLAINDYRYCGADIGNGRIDLYQSYSDDQGENWSTPGHMLDADGNPVSKGDGEGTVDTSLDNDDCGFGDPAMVSDSETGKVLVMSVCGRTPFFSATRSNPNQVARWYSEDGGDSWTNYENITEQIYTLFDEKVPNGSVDALFFGSGKICQSRQVKVGESYRLYAVVSGRNVATGNLSNWVLYSDDFGKTWAVLGDPMQPAVSSSADEPKAEELPDGSVLLAARGNGGNRNFNIFRYTDIKKAEGKWDGSINTNCGAGFTLNACNGEILILPAKDASSNEQCYIALQSIPYNGSRTNVSILWKVITSGSDILTPSCFGTWNGRFQVTNLPSAYSTMTLQSNNTIGFIYEEECYSGKDYCEVYRNLSLEDITDGAYTYNEDKDNAKANAIRTEVVTARSSSYNESKYVGQPTAESLARFKTGVDAYTANPSEETYLTFNAAAAALADDDVITIQKNGLYRITSAHDTYTAITTPRYLNSDGTNLVVTETDDSANYFALMQRSNSDNWILYHPSTTTFATISPATSSVFAVTDSVENAKEYAIVSAITGKSNLTCAEDATNTSYASLHMDSSQRVVAWGKAAGASQWYLELMGTADALPKIEEETIVISAVEPATEPAQRSYYDLLGRPVAVPKPGQLYITSDRKKVVF